MGCFNLIRTFPLRSSAAHHLRFVLKQYFKTCSGEGTLLLNLCKYKIKYYYSISLWDEKHCFARGRGLSAIIIKDKIKFNMNKKLDPQLLIFAKSMRHTATDAEHLMWQILRAKRFMNLKFRRQHVIKPYIVDFTAMKLVW